MTTPDTWRPVPLRLRVMEHDDAHFGEDVTVLRWNAEDGGLAQRIFRPGDWEIRPAWADGVTTPTPARRPRRGLRAVRFEGYRFGTGNVTLRWRAEDGTVAQRTFLGSVWDIMPAWAERDYHAAVTARQATRCDVERVRPAQPLAPPAPGVTPRGL